MPLLTVRPRGSRDPLLRARRFLAALLALAVAGLVAAPLAAQAEPNPGIVVADVAVASADGGQATVGDILTLSGTWDATAADPQPGDTFSIGLPSALGFPQAIPFPLSGPDPNGDVRTWATCLTDPASGVATCTLTDEVLVYPEYVSGDFEVDIEARQATTEEALEFDLNGTGTLVDLPGTGGIDDGITLPTGWDKSGELNADKWSMSWTIELPGSRLAGEDVVTVLDALSDNHILCEPSQLKVETVRGPTVVDVTSIAAISRDVAAPADFAIVLTAPAEGFRSDVTYRITYDTCTPDGLIDPKGTVYENEATVDVFGESSGVIGVTQDWELTAAVSKQGSVLGGGARNGEIRWTITVAGDHLQGKDAFTLTEALTGDHEVCAATIDGLRVVERYGPSNSRQREVTGELVVTTLASGPAGFEAELAIADGSSFEFLPSDHAYLVQYVTCATTDGLPEGGTAFGNSATIDGVTDGSETRVPGRTDEKRGAINTGATTLDGVERLPQTTLDWRITVPGEKLADLEGDLEITDVLSATHQVCESDGTVAERLGLRVEARDQIQNGGLATVVLDATAAVAGDTITLTVAEPTLPLPEGGEHVGFSREYQYVVTYTTCTVSGGMDAPGTVYGNSAQVAGSTYGHTATQNNNGSGTGQGVARGSVGIVKQLSDTPGADLVPEDAAFTVHVREIDPTGTPQIEYDLEVPLGGAPVSGPNSRGLGWTAELSEPVFPDIPGVTFGDPVFSPGPGVTVSEDGTTAVAELTPGSNIPITLTNTALLGAISVQKIVDGPAAGLVDADREYTVTAAIDVSGLGAGFPAQPDRTFPVRAGQTVQLDELPIGAVVTFTETPPGDDDILTWAPAEFSPESVEVLPEHAAEPAAVTVTNTVSRTVGTFSIVKSVTGDEAGNPAVPEEVTVTATWVSDGAPAQTTLSVPTDGTPVPLGANLLIGTEVTLTEAPLADGSGIAWSSPVWSGDGVTVDGERAVVTIGRSADATVSLVNHAATSTAGISLLKGLAGAAAGEVDPATRFPVTATWTDADGEPQSRDLTIGTTEPTPLGVELPAGTVVTITEGERPAFATVDWGSIVFSGSGVTDAGDGSATIVVSDQQSDVTLVTVVNEANWAPGSIALSKDVVGVLRDDADVPTTVTAVATWLDAAGDTRSTQLVLPTDGTSVPLGEDVPHGTEVALSELALADSDRFTWSTPTWSGDRVVDRGDGTAVVTVSAATVAEVVLTNEAVADLGSLRLVKALEGDGAGRVPAGTAFPLTLSWVGLTGDLEELETEVRAGTATVVDGVPLGVEVRVVEHAAALPHGLQWADVTWLSEHPDVLVTPDPEGTGAVVEIAGDASETVDVGLTNRVVVLPDLAASGTAAPLWAVGAAAVLLLLGGGSAAWAARPGAARRPAA